MARPDTEIAVRALVQDAAFKRGKELLSAKKLQDVAFEGDDLQKATAVCEGSNPGDCYDVSISVEPEVTCNCTCPAKRGGFCKHAIALLLQRVNQLEGKNGASTSGSPKKNDEEEEEIEDSKAVVEWVRNPVKLVPDPQARRALPEWMNSSVSEKPKKERASKKQKLNEEGDEPQSSGRRTTGKKKTGGRASKAAEEADEPDDDAREVVARGKGKAKAKEKDEFLDDDEEPARPARQTNSREKKPAEAVGDDEERRVSTRGRRKKASSPEEEEDEEAEEVRPRGRGRGRRVNEEQQKKAPEINKRRFLRVVEDEEENENDDTLVDATMDELLSIAQKNLANQDTTNNPVETKLDEVDAQPTKKKTKLDNSMFSLNKWKEAESSDRLNGGESDGSMLYTPRGQSDGEMPGNVSGASTATGQLNGANAAGAFASMTDEQVMDGMYECLLGFAPARQPSPVREVEAARKPSPVRDFGGFNTAPVQAQAMAPEEPAFVPVPPVSFEAPVARGDTVMQGQPKKKSSLKDKMKMLGL